MLRTRSQCRRTGQTGRTGRTVWKALAITAIVVGSSVAVANADSSLVLPYPEAFGVIPATTYDSEHHRVGGAMLAIAKMNSGMIRIVGTTGIDHGAYTVVTSELETVESPHGLRLLSQESRSVDPDGVSLGLLRIDHRKRKGTCTTPGSDGEPRSKSVELPENDRVVNVPLMLLFQPLARGEVETTTFQLFLCRGGPRLLDVEARMSAPDPSKSHLREVVYGPDFGLFSDLVGGLLPSFSFWFDERAPHRWMAHNLPLYSKGPEVFVVREGVPASWLAAYDH